MISKEILVSLMVIGIVGAVAGGSTLAVFSDTETSSGNTFAAGSIDGQIGLSQGGDSSNDVYFGPNADYPEGTPFFTYEDQNGGTPGFATELGDVKPGDQFERTVAMKAGENPYYACATITGIANDEVSVNDPESDVDPNNNQVEPGPITDSGELAQYSTLHIWAETDGDNQYDSGEPTVIRRASALNGGGGIPTDPVTWTIADAKLNIYDFDSSVTTSPGGDNINGEDAIMANTPVYMGVNITLPIGVGDQVQTDSYSADVVFDFKQSKNNGDFSCKEVAAKRGDADWFGYPSSS